MGQFSCECSRCGPKDQCQWTDMHAAAFTMPDGTVVYVAGDYNTYGEIEVAVEGGRSAKVVIVDGAGGESAHPGLTATYSYGYFTESLWGEDNYPADGIGCGVRIPGEDVVAGVRLCVPDSAVLPTVVPSAVATALRFPVTAATPYSAHFRKSTLGRAKTVARLDLYGRMRAAVASGDEAAFDAAQREILVDLSRVSHETRTLDVAMRNRMYEAMRANPNPHIARMADDPWPVPPDEPEVWSFESWYADSVARRDAGNLFDELKALKPTARVYDYLLTSGGSSGDTVGWDLAKLEREVAARRGPSAAEPAAPDAAAAPQWSASEVDAMTVKLLKEALTELGLETTGLKAVLKARLVEALGF